MVTADLDFGKPVGLMELIKVIMSQEKVVLVALPEGFRATIYDYSGNDPTAKDEFGEKCRVMSWARYELKGLPGTFSPFISVDNEVSLRVKYGRVLCAKKGKNVSLEILDRDTGITRKI